MNKENLFKLMFALEIALLPMIISAKLMMPDWCIALFVGMIVVAKLVMIVVKNPANNMQLYLDAIGNVVVIVAGFIIFTCFGYVNLVMSILACVFIVTEEFVRVVFYFKPNNQLIDALNFSCEMFIFLSLAGMLVAPFNAVILEVAVVALVINAIVLTVIQGYRYIYYYVIRKNKRSKRK